MSQQQRYSVHDLDPEEAATAVVTNLEQQHKQQQSQERTAHHFGHSSVVKTRVVRLEAAVKAQQAASGHKSHNALQDMMETTAITAPTKDGLMKQDGKANDTVQTPRPDDDDASYQSPQPRRAPSS